MDNANLILVGIMFLIIIGAQYVHATIVAKSVHRLEKVVAALILLNQQDDDDDLWDFPFDLPESPIGANENEK